MSSFKANSTLGYFIGPYKIQKIYTHNYLYKGNKSKNKIIYLYYLSNVLLAIVLVFACVNSIYIYIYI